MKLNRERLKLIPLFMTVLIFFGYNKFQSAPSPDLPLQNLMPVIKPSVINLNITVDLDEGFRDIEKSVRQDNREVGWEEFPERASGNGFCLSGAVICQNRSTNGNPLHIRTTMNYKLRYGHKIARHWHQKLSKVYIWYSYRPMAHSSRKHHR